MEKLDLSPLITSFHDFFTSIYKDNVNKVLLQYPTERSIIVDYHDLERYNPELADELVKSPDIVIKAAETAIEQMNFSVPTGEKFKPHIRFFNLVSNETLIEHIGSKSINELVYFKGVITRRAEVMHRVKMAVYVCQLCDTEIRFPVEKNFVPPKRCDSCKKLSLKQDEEKSTFTDIQRAEIQELLERVRGGAPAAHIELYLEDDLVNKVSPGDNVEIIGTLRLRPPLKTKQKQELVYGRYIEANNVKSMKRDFEEIEITKEDEARLRDLSKDPNISERVRNSIAPSIYGHNEVKRAIALQLFGGTKGKTMKGGAPIRDDVHILLIGDPGIAKCVDGTTDVMLADGSIQKISDVVNEMIGKKGIHKKDEAYATGNHDLLSLNVDGKIRNSKATVFWKVKAPKNIYKINMASGKEIIVTPEHPFFIFDGSFIKGKNAGDINAGEFVATPRNIPIKGKKQQIPKIVLGKRSKKIDPPTYLTPEFARFLGYLTGDGYLRKTNTTYEISLTNKDSYLLRDFCNILRSMGVRAKVKKNGKKIPIAIACSTHLGIILDKLNMIRTSGSKEIPQEILKSPNNVCAEFIKGFFECEASVRPKNTGIIVVSKSKSLLEKTQLLLLRFGIRSQLHPTTSRATNTKKNIRRTYYRLNLLGNDARTYMRLIGFNSSKKKKAKFPVKTNTNKDIVPNTGKLLRSLRAASGLSQRECGIPRTTMQHYERGDRNPSRDSLRKIFLALKNKIKNKEIKLLEELVNSDIFWDRIVSKKKINGDGRWLYDLQIDPTHNFIANGLVVHNTRFLSSVSDIAPKSIYVSGKSVSGAGLTVSAEKDELGEGGWTLKAGALVLASGGSAQIDEFDKIDEEDRASLHEAMESGSISVAKAGIVAKFRTKTSILAAANPKYGRFDQTKNLADQFDVPSTLLSRFDLIFPIVDVLDEERDSKLAQHILSTHMGTNIEDGDEFDKDLLRKYISYARRRVHPKLTQQASNRIKEFYVDLRTKSRDAGSVAITPRYLEGLVRLAEANAKMRLSKTVDENDAQVAIDLFNYVMKQIMTDKETGAFDVDVVATGKPRSEREKMQKTDTIMEIIREQLKDKDSADIEEIISEAQSYDIDEKVARRIINEMLRKGEIYEKEHGHVRIVGGN